MAEPAGAAEVVVLPAGGDFGGGPAGLLWSFGTGCRSHLAALPEGWQAVEAGDAVNAAADRLRPMVGDLDAHLFDGAPPLAWWASSTAERNPYVSDLFLSLAQAVALVEAVRRGGRHVVTVDDPALGRALVDVLRRAGVAARWLGPGPRPLARLGGALKAAAAALRDGWRQGRAARRHGLAGEALRGRNIWLLTWVGAKPPAADGFLGELPAWLGRWGAAFGWLGHPTAWTGDIDAIAAATARAAEPAALVAGFVPLAARLGAIWRGLALARMPVRPLVALGIDLSPLVRRALDREAAAGVAMRALAYAEIGRSCRRRGLRPHTLVYTYENQPWEKMLLAGFRRHLPATRLIGVQHAVFADRYLSCEPTPAQVAAGLFPDLLVASGEEFRDRLAGRGVAAGRLAVGGALRFPDLADLGDAPCRARIAAVLATLPMQADEGAELAHKAALATAGLGLRLLVNFHPMLDEAARTAIRDRVTAAVAHPDLRFVDGPAGRWLAESDLVLYTSSGTVFEAARAGVPAAYVGPACGLDLEKLPGGGSLRCRSVADLAALVARLRTDPDAVARAVAEARGKAARCFAPPDPEAWRRVLRLDDSEAQVSP